MATRKARPYARQRDVPANAPMNCLCRALGKPDGCHVCRPIKPPKKQPR